MKINKNLYKFVEGEPFDTQVLESGGKIELHLMNKEQNVSFFNEYAQKAKFAVWTSQNGKDYKIVLEEGYYKIMRELYMTRVNQLWTGFWDEVEKGRKKVMLTLFLPIVIVTIAAATLLMFFGKNLDNTAQLLSMGGILMIFIIGNVIVNKKIDKIINASNNKATEGIKNIVGHDHFEELMEAQRAYYDEFFGIEPEEEEAPAEEKDEEAKALEEPKEEALEEAKEE